MKILTLTLFLAVMVFASIDINNASIKELTSLKGIGKKKAEAIISYRNIHCFKSVDELTKVKGIGKKIVKKNRAEIEVGECQR